MQQFFDVSAMRAYAMEKRLAGEKIALVPTMGALHEGHLTLVREAKKQATIVIVSIFVNPTQFAPTEDLAQYPRTLEADKALLEKEGVDAVFTPTTGAIYTPNDRTWVIVEDLDKNLCGAFRPGHFNGVTTIVLRLFLATMPHVAVFGLKDAQQFFILKRMATDLHLETQLVGVPTVRETDGLAMSSRNRYLNREERNQAVVLSQALTIGKQLIEAGETDVERVKNAICTQIEKAPLAQIQYVEIVETELLTPIKKIVAQMQVLLAIAVYFGKTRLIDNVLLITPEGKKN